MTVRYDGPLTDEQVASFNERGYLVVDFSLDSEMLDRIVEKVAPLYGEEYRLNPHAPTRYQDAWKKVDEVRQLATDERIGLVLEQLLKRKSFPFQTLNFPIGSRQCAHSDTVHFNSIPAGYMAGVWVALEDMDEDNGPLIYYPGSHKLHEYTMQDFGIEPKEENYPQYEECLRKVIEEQQLVAEYGTIKKGEALIWHANLLHGGAAQKDFSRTRHSQVTHYYFENCKYYTPMESTEDEIQYRNPVRIPEKENFKLFEDRPRAVRALIRIKRMLGFK